jgi:histidinol-phosphate/aromatic aminotransferase/cobyric acid decarboxylase-like protein
LFDALQQQKIFVRYFPGELTGDYLRVTIATEAEMTALLSSLDRILETLEK